MYLKLIQNNYLANAVYQQGKSFLEEERSFFCAACGNVSCSSECHEEHHASENQCTFYLNFAPESNIHSLPSIVSKNIQLAQKNKLPVGKILNKTSNFFIMAYNHPKQNWVYLQRGYRQYGNPIETTFEKFNVFQQKNIDFYKLKKRTCVCNCRPCSEKHEHSILNCSRLCENKNLDVRFSMDEIFDYNKLDLICNCNCKLCSSGIINSTHMLRDCLDQCQHNILLKEIEQN